MIRINKNFTVNLSKIAKKHWNSLNHEVENRLQDALDKKTYSTLTAVIESDAINMLKWFETNLDRIILGKPRVLNDIIQEFKVKNSNIQSILEQECKDNDKPLTCYIFNIFDYNKFCDETLKHFYEKEIEFLKEISKPLDIHKVPRNATFSEREGISNSIKIHTLNKITHNFVKSKDDFLNNVIKELKQTIEEISDLRTLGVGRLRGKIVERINIAIKKLNKQDEVDQLNYIKYKKKYKNGWSAYQLVLELGLKTCPYCNRQFISTYHSKKGKTRGDLDHFFPKSLYPYLCLSFYNLIPSCKVCNSSLKGRKDFIYGDNIHPYEEGFDDKIIFTYNADEVSSFYNSDKLVIKLTKNLNLHVDNDFLKKADNNINVFKLNPLYNTHKDIVANMLRIRQAYSDSAIDSIMAQHPGLFKSRQEVLEMLLSSNLDPKHLHKGVLSKLIRDIALELKLIK